jgi:low temperature requirement protein LtrA
MTTGHAGKSLLRVRGGHEHSRVSYVELFFDLVFVFAITQLSHTLFEHLTPGGLLQTAGARQPAARPAPCGCRA